MQTKFLIILAGFSMWGCTLFAQKADDVLAYISTYKEFAISEMKRTGIPAAIKLAQGIHETEAGKSDLVRRSNNHFGIKCKSSWAGEKVFHDDDARGECFRSYGKPVDSYMDHSDFLKGSSRYSFLFNLDPTDYEGWAYGLKKAGYATNIRYSQVLIKIINTYNLQDYTLIAMGKMKEGDHTWALNKSGLQPKPVITEVKKEEPAREILVRPTYPAGEFVINKTRVVYAEPNKSWLSLAEQYKIPLTRLWDFNDLEEDDDILHEGQLVYLQRKRKVGSAEFHILRDNETLYDVCQTQGIRFESLLELNHLKDNMKPLAGERLNLQYLAFNRPALETPQRNKAVSDNGSAQDFSVPALQQRNAGQNMMITTGNTAKPESLSHLVSSKETLYSISRKYGVEPQKIMEWNNLDNMAVKIGQSLVIHQR